MIIEINTIEKSIEISGEINVGEIEKIKGIYPNFRISTKEVRTLEIREPNTWNPFPTLPYSPYYRPEDSGTWPMQPPYKITCTTESISDGKQH